MAVRLDSRGIGFYHIASAGAVNHQVVAHRASRLSNLLTDKITTFGIATAVRATNFLGDTHFVINKTVLKTVKNNLLKFLFEKERRRKID